MTTQPQTPGYARALAENERYAAQIDRSTLPLPPGRKLVVLACTPTTMSVSLRRQLELLAGATRGASRRRRPMRPHRPPA